MKIFAILTMLLLSSCATTVSTDSVIKNTASQYALSECSKIEEFKEDETSFKIFIDKYIDLVDLYSECKTKHKELIEFYNKNN